jgi:hypothetical protein
MKAQTLIVKGAHADTKTFDFSSPSAEDLAESAIFLSKEGIAYDESGTVLPFSFLSMPQQQLEAELNTAMPDIFESRRQRSTSLDKCIYIPALVPGYWNYYHLLIDCLPRVLLSLQTVGARILMTQFQAARLQRAQGNLLTQIGRIFGLREYFEVVKGDLLHLERAIVPKHKVRFIGSSMQLFQDVGARSGKGSAQRRIYISRKLTSARRVTNDDAVVETLRDFGFQPVCLEQEPLSEQVRIFREADVIIGPHGAGLANIVFSRSGTTLIEFLQESATYKVPLFSELTAMAEGRHVVLLSKPEINPNHPGHAGNMDMSVNCMVLRSALESLLGRQDCFSAPPQPPILDVRFKSGFANRMIQYMVVRRIAAEVQGCLISNAVLPEWGINHAAIPGAPDPSVKIPIAENCLNIAEIARSLSTGEMARFNFRSYAQWFPNFPHLNVCRKMFPSAESTYPGYGPEYLVCNVRGEEVLTAIHPAYTLLPIEFYVELANTTGLKLVFMGQVADNAYCRALRQQFPDAIFQPTRGALADFQTLRNSRNIVVAISTFSWLAAWLSYADSIFLPVNGLFHPVQCPEVDLLPVSDTRYRFYLFPINYAVPVDRFEKAHKALEGHWRYMHPETVAELRTRVARKSTLSLDKDKYVAMFDEKYYLQTYPDIARALQSGGLPSGRHHYVQAGFRERRFGFLFDARWYSIEYPLAAFEVGQGDYADLRQHYVEIGAARGYKPHPRRGRPDSC